MWRRYETSAGEAVLINFDFVVKVVEHPEKPETLSMITMQDSPTVVVKAVLEDIYSEVLSFGELTMTVGSALDVGDVIG